ncbi:MAG TPA: hypothetical protein PLR20_00005, partial [Syntrophales bacterium]|nr:hypothetical protein [Syntrophales bacterium]HPI55753.1 hypothetical protein [Syntrophales bacterium]HQM27719.1 hypothetical protein [Syntrophales bacterium]
NLLLILDPFCPKPFDDVHKGGTYTSSIPLTLPTSAKKGLYVVVSTIQSDNLSDTIQTAFTVK